MNDKGLMQCVCIFAIFFLAVWDITETKIEYHHRPKGSTVADKIVRITTSDVTVARKTCSLIPERGPCRANIGMYYFDPETGQCPMFTWGGCQGNGNRFDSEIECLNSCLKNATDVGRPVWCGLSFDYGFCFGEVKRYYYDHMWKVCKEAIYSGCGGNKNNFYSFEQCESVCRFGHGTLDATERAVTGSKKVLIMNPDGIKSKQNKRQK